MFETMFLCKDRNILDGTAGRRVAMKARDASFEMKKLEGKRITVVQETTGETTIKTIGRGEIGDREA